MKPIAGRMDEQSGKMGLDIGNLFFVFPGFQSFVFELPFRRDHPDHRFEMEKILMKTGDDPFPPPYILKHHGPPQEQALKHEIVHYPPFWFDPIPRGSKWTTHPAVVFCTLPNDTLPKYITKTDRSVLTYNFVHNGSNGVFAIESD